MPMITQLQRGCPEQEIRCIYTGLPATAFVLGQDLIPLEAELTVRIHRAQDNDEPRCESAEVRRAADTGWNQLRTATSAFRAPVLVMPGALSPTLCPGQLSAGPSVPYSAERPDTLLNGAPTIPRPWGVKGHGKNPPGPKQLFPASSPSFPPRPPHPTL